MIGWLVLALAVAVIVLRGVWVEWGLTLADYRTVHAIAVRDRRRADREAARADNLQHAVDELRDQVNGLRALLGVAAPPVDEIPVPLEEALRDAEQFARVVGPLIDDDRGDVG